MISCDFLPGRLQAAHCRHKLAFYKVPPHFAEEEKFHHDRRRQHGHRICSDQHC